MVIEDPVGGGGTNRPFCLGEYVSDPAAIRQTVSGTIDAVRELGAAELDAHVSVDPTAVGFLAGEQEVAANVRQIAEVVAAQPAAGHRYVILDMEDLSLVDPTLGLHATLMAEGLPVAVTVQARLRRSEQDLRALLAQPTAVRLVKGAFPLGAEHDHRLTLRVVEIAREVGWQPSEYEFEMLYGVRPAWQRQLRARGESLRVYLPFGTDWWPYAARRAGENARNLLLLGRSLLDRRG